MKHVNILDAVRFTPPVEWILRRAIKLAWVRRDEYVRLEDIATAYQDFPKITQDEMAEDLAQVKEGK